MAKTTGKNLRTTRFSFRRMALYGVALALALLIASAVMGAVLAVRDMRDRADVSLTNAKARIESSVAESFKLLESLAEQPTLYERSVWVMDKVTMLDQVNEHFGYFLLCYVDDEMNVWDVTGSASLASRDFMQKCYSTGQGLVTDSFAAGADGVTLNYVVLVPLFDGGEMTGSLFVSLYFDDMVRILAESDEAGPFLMSTENGRQIFVTGHPEYDKYTLDAEYKRDVGKGLPIAVPKNYYPNDDPEQPPLFRWRAHAHLLYENWLNYYVYQNTPYDLGAISKVEHEEE